MYEAPQVSEIGTIEELTQGDLFSPGQDALSNIPIIGDLFGS
jgi:hypothetical protein